MKNEEDNPDTESIHFESDEGLLPLENAAGSTEYTHSQYGCARAISVTLFLVFIVLASIFGASRMKMRTTSYCQNPSLRQEWRMLSVEARQKYIAAILCLSKRPSRLGLNNTRYDDFVYSHLAVFNTTHGQPISLPWHRLYIQQFEDALRSECGYDGNLAYWDWTLDAPSPSNSLIWSTESGFSGNGSSPENCLVAGPLAQMRPQYPEPHCLRRNFSAENMFGVQYTAQIVERLITDTKTYHEFRYELEQGPHRWIHRAIGGEMPQPWSTNDPIFFMHHAQIDRLWWKWQRRGPDSRVRGVESMDSGSDRPSISPHDALRLNGLGKDRIVKDVLSTATALLCYKYPAA